ncbi:hypothetical protein PPERSA_05897 [Pseudocohnilembus persalinus]|uniref:Tetratricopeptide repeat protein n=1 Tax=Pseudocohnilembus persalinus TaxID=266149 RepID=A0A0V0R413_PSEPJ|nr:hypothetical protein PPERSA_05897 [Pseudocohnilembus persalinus]|eukprot:KRX09228.1 hypothetical protein PPERSA_05897 [Pseudocohnilembus persalinus]
MEDKVYQKDLKKILQQLINNRKNLKSQSSYKYTAEQVKNSEKNIFNKNNLDKHNNFYSPMQFSSTTFKTEKSTNMNTPSQTYFQSNDQSIQSIYLDEFDLSYKNFSRRLNKKEHDSVPIPTKLRELVHIGGKQEGPFFEILKNELFCLMSETVDRNNINLFYKLVNFVGFLALEEQKYDYAIYFFHQLVLLSNLTEKYYYKAKAFLYLGKCAIKLNVPEKAILLLKRGMQYCWANQYQDLELLIYEETGKAYYTMGNIKKAEEYHQLYVNGHTELKDTKEMNYSNSVVQYYDQKLEKKYTNLNVLLIGKLDLPLLSLNEMPQVLPQNENYTKIQFDKYGEEKPASEIIYTSPRSIMKPFRQQKWQNANGLEIIDNLLATEEFDLRLPTPTKKTSKLKEFLKLFAEEITILTQDPEFPLSGQILQSLVQHINQDYTNNIYSKTKHKMNLGQKIYDKSFTIDLILINRCQDLQPQVREKAVLALFEILIDLQGIFFQDQNKLYKQNTNNQKMQEETNIALQEIINYEIQLKMVQVIIGRIKDIKSQVRLAILQEIHSNQKPLFAEQYYKTYGQIKRHFD